MVQYQRAAPPGAPLALQRGLRLIRHPLTKLACIIRKRASHDASGFFYNPILDIINRMKIALITDTYYAINGVSRTYQQFADYCRKRQIALDIFTIGKNHQVTRQGSVTIRQFAASWPVQYYFDLPPFDAKIVSPGLKEALTKNHFDLIQLATPGSLGIAARILLANGDTPKVGVFHTLLAEYAGDWTKQGLKNLPPYFKHPMAEMSEKLVWKMLKWFYAPCDLILAPSQTVKRRLRILQRPLDIFPRGVDTELFQPATNRKKTKKPIALYVGRLSTEKNLDLLVKIWKKCRDCELWLVGDGPYRAGLENQLPHATFFGYQIGQRLSELYASADLFIFPSVTDTFGNVVLEAQASGLPTIVTSVGGPKELVEDGITGFVAKPTAAAFNHCLDKLVKNSTLRKKMAQSARRAALTANWPHAFDQLFSIYFRTCNKSSH